MEPALSVWSVGGYEHTTFRSGPKPRRFSLTIRDFQFWFLLPKTTSFEGGELTFWLCFVPPRKIYAQFWPPRHYMAFIACWRLVLMTMTHLCQQGRNSATSGRDKTPSESYTITTAGERHRSCGLTGWLKMADMNRRTWKHKIWICKTWQISYENRLHYVRVWISFKF